MDGGREGGREEREEREGGEGGREGCVQTVLGERNARPAVAPLTTRGF